ncbi:hypothetical protein ABWK26_20160 [Bacillus toyonensis]|uniref:hypothetical protein n=1 Tax=Bacillus TaxID=1386 RepID=UPI00032FAC2A|nr:MULTISPECIES: hypothetical protein [Bacillus]EOP29612.1 hypothetical protein IIS_05290 [Bacillus cereus VD131]KAF6547536.1 hypothetical protein G9F74_27520 [Bacillus sp. EKM202B]MBJ8043360.1 hypothetical protein [Bacillus cereus group sp. N17]MBJ8068082.1 hypothetical protein [Bacillus cereus group sp. N15]MCS3600778.1 hypothetical protein [Bacillus sp. JUb91]
MPCNPDNYVFSLCTDADRYGAGATSVDAECTYSGGGIAGPNGNTVAPNWSYTFNLQYQSGSSWVNKRSASGTFNHQTPTKALSLSGLPAGRYRVLMTYKSQANPSYKGSVNTYSFSVARS